MSGMGPGGAERRIAGAGTAMLCMGLAGLWVTQQTGHALPSALLYLVTTGHSTLPDILASAMDERGPFSDHLRNHLFRLHGHDDLIQGLKQVLKDQTCKDEEIFWRLRGAGLVRRSGRKVVPRYKLYTDYFEERLHA